jgi:Mrp family chromosome partitioning ATPase
LVAFHDADQPLSQQYREMLTGLLATCGDHAGARSPAMLFAAVRPGAETTTVVLNLAISAARQGRRRVVVVDANLHQPRVAARLGLEEAPGLREALAGTISLDRAIRATEQDNLLALTAGTLAPGEGPRFVAETMRSLLRQVRQRFDLVLVDGPGWDGRPETISLASACDAVYLVLSEQEAESSEVDHLLQAIPEQGIRLGGCILSGR